MGACLQDTLAGDLGASLPAQFGVWPDAVVIVPRSRQHYPGLGQRSEQGLIEAFVLQDSSPLLSSAVPALVGGPASSSMPCNMGNGTPA